MDKEDYIELDIDRLLQEANEEKQEQEREEEREEAYEEEYVEEREEEYEEAYEEEYAEEYVEECAEENAVPYDEENAVSHTEEDTAPYEDLYDEALKGKTEKVERTRAKRKRKKRYNKKTRIKLNLIRTALVLSIMTVMYLTVVYSNIPFIEKWRTIYIETAMTTNSHQWLATLFFPQSVIDEVMARRKKNAKKQKKVKTKWKDEDIIVEKSNAFYDKYWELDTPSFRQFVEKQYKADKDERETFFIDNFEEKENIKTTNGDLLLLLDTENNLMILKVKGEGYQGKMAIVKDPSQVGMAKARSLGSIGQEAGSFGESTGALLVINASAFEDADGVGYGGEVMGSMVIDGVEYGKPYREHWKFCGFKKNNRMYITNYSSDIVEEYRWGFEFFPAMIVDGKSPITGGYGMGIQPRATIGQAQNGDFLMLIVDGRQPGHSIGCSLEECQRILESYHAYQAMNLDGGSSAIMWYNGKYITKSSSVTGIGRYMPDALVVWKAKKDTVAETE